MKLAKTATARKAPAPETKEETGASPITDLNADIKKMIAEGKVRGYVTYDNLNAALPPD